MIEIIKDAKLVDDAGNVHMDGVNGYLSRFNHGNTIFYVLSCKGNQLDMPEFGDSSASYKLVSGVADEVLSPSLRFKLSNANLMMNDKVGYVYVSFINYE
jgi:hypothetical protein